MAKTFYRRIRHFCIFQKNGITLLIVSYSSNARKKKMELGITMLLIQIYEAIGHSGVNFVYVCCHRI